MDPWHLLALAVAQSVLGTSPRLQPAPGPFREQLEGPLPLTMRVRDGEEEKEFPEQSKVMLQRQRT